VNRYVFVFRDIGNHNRSVSAEGHTAREALQSLVESELEGHMETLILDRMFLREGGSLILLNKALVLH
jgi:hypothetical protein